MTAHTAYIFAAYAATAFVIAVMIARAVVGYRQRRRKIGQLEAQGARRRSQRD
jgi:heme exporter protein CcmD